MAIRNSAEGINEYLEDILLIIERVCHPNNDIEMRMDFMCLLDFIIQ